MLHHIIVKFNSGVDKEKVAAEALKLFSELKGSNGIHGVDVKLNCVPRANRYDMCIIIDMDKDALDYYDESVQHKKWKSDFACYIESKAIFDSN